MKISISKNELKEALAGLTKVIPKKPSIPMLSVLKISSDKKSVRITATNLDEWITYVVNDTPNPECSFMINIHELKDFVFKTKSAQYYGFTVTDDKHINVTTDDYRFPEKIFNTSLVDEDEWPQKPIVTEDNNKISVQVFKYIKEAIPSASKDDTRSVIKGILLEPDSIVSTNGKELVQFSCKTGINTKVVIPVTKFLTSGKLTESNGTISVNSVNGREYCIFTTDSWEYAVNTLIGNYPDYKQVIPKTTSGSIQISSNDIEYLQKAIPLLESSSEHNAVHLFADSNEISFLSENLKSSVLRAKGVYKGLGSNQPVVISINRNLLIRALSLGFNKFSFNAGYSPVIATGANDSLMVFMPLKGCSVSIEKITAKVQNKGCQGRCLEVPKNDDIRRKNSTVDSEKAPEKQQVTKNSNRAFSKKEVQMSESKSSNYPPIIKSANDIEIEPITELMDSITILKIKARDIIDLASDLNKKVKDIQKSKKVQEREFINTRKLLEKLKNVSGF